MHRVPKFETIKAKQQIYSCYLDSKLDIFNFYMPKNTSMNHELALKNIKLINILSKSLIHKQKHLTVLLQNRFKHQPSLYYMMLFTCSIVLNQS
jgi:hypothetical protein